MNNWTKVACLYNLELLEQFKINKETYYFTEVGLMDKKQVRPDVMLKLANGTYAIDGQEPINTIAEIIKIAGLELNKLYEINCFIFKVTFEGIEVQGKEKDSYLYSFHLQAAIFHSIILGIALPEPYCGREEDFIANRLNSVLTLALLLIAAFMSGDYWIVVYCSVAIAIIIWDTERKKNEKDSDDKG